MTLTIQELKTMVEQFGEENKASIECTTAHGVRLSEIMAEMQEIIQVFNDNLVVVERQNLKPDLVGMNGLAAASPEAFEAGTLELAEFAQERIAYIAETRAQFLELCVIVGALYNSCAQAYGLFTTSQQIAEQRFETIQQVRINLANSSTHN